MRSLAVWTAFMAVAAQAAAQDATPPAPPDTSSWTCKFCPFASGLEGTVEAGPAHVSDDSFRFGDYTGFDHEGWYLSAGSELKYRNDSALDLGLSARDLGVAGRVLEVDAERPGQYGLHAGYRGSPKLRSGTATTPFRGLGDTGLGLPAGWTTADTTGSMSDLEASLHGADLRLDRQRVDLGAVFHSTARSEYRLDYRRDRRSGTEAKGATFLTDASLLPKPVDDVTEQLELSTALERAQWQWRAAYRGSYFRNATDFLTWQNPYDPLSPGATQGRLALAPDNQSHQLSTALALQSLPRTTLTGQMVFGRLLQTADLVPATINPDLAQPLPRGDADGRVDTLDGTVRSGTRLTPTLRLNLEYRYRDRDNRTPTELYPQVQTDVFAADPRLNRPYDFTDQRFRLSLRQQLPAGARIQAGYDGNVTQRALQAVDRTAENTVWGRISLLPTEQGTLDIRVARGRRDGPAPHALEPGAPPENPRQRQFNLADRDRSAANVRLTIVQNETWSYGAGADYAHDDYSGTEIGLTDGREFNLNADLAYTPVRDTAITASAARARLASRQAGSQSFSVADWRADNRDVSDTLTFGLEQRNILDRVDLSASYTLAGSRGETTLNDGGQVRQFPDLATRLQGLGVRARYRVNASASLVLGLRHERYRSDDWQRDGLEAATVPKLLATTLESPDYRVNLVWLALQWSFGAAEEETERRP